MMVASRPIRFVVGVVALWTGARAWMLWPVVEQQIASVVAGAIRPPAMAAVLPIAPTLPCRGPCFGARTAPMLAPRGISLLPKARPGQDAGDDRRTGSQGDDASLPSIATPDNTGQRTVAVTQPLAPFPGTNSHWSGSVWAYVRHDGQGGLATGGQLGGSQAGARILYRPLPELPVALAMRVSRPLEQKGAEGAIGIDWQPIPAIRFAIERRIKLETGGRDAWTAFAAGGMYDRKVAGLRLDAYAQAGMVGARSHDLFADGAVRIGHEIGPVTVGAGAWGAAQPHVERIDVGPQAVLRLPVGGVTLSAAADWRFRVVGEARPGSGPAFTIGMDF